MGFFFSYEHNFWRQSYWPPLISTTPPLDQPQHQHTDIGAELFNNRPFPNSNY
ncbi:hypothetical protein HOLleu_18444 [Holothuria leucospilota]|uniref:Uncharacterized protein n=1 Tax=Holothuria leucospilota TaxID=206669 RepID=A0A9Q1C1T6_HOLLE|nr:hypothetical protein HOLleu_18444 [Holothuria leucospilota]